MYQSPIADWHREHHARLVEFAGWDMPVQYSTIVEEHYRVRSAAGLFDVSHMGRLTFTGPDSGKFLDYMLTCSVKSMRCGQVKYSLMCREDGGILDDVLVYRTANEWQLVVNASNRLRIIEWLDRFRSEYSVSIEDRTFATAMFALQGPRSPDVLEVCFPKLPEQLKRYSCCEVSSAQFGDVFVSRTGYTGEDGFEFVASADSAEALWTAILLADRDVGVVPAGLGSRNTLRLEAGMPLYGSEINEDTDPLTAGLGFAVNLDGGDFVGRDRLQQIDRSPITLKRVGLILEGRRIVRDHCPIQLDGEDVGSTTSGTFSPTLDKSIAMAMLETSALVGSQPLSVILRNTPVPARVVPLPFYSRS